VFPSAGHVPLGHDVLTVQHALGLDAHTDVPLGQAVHLPLCGTSLAPHDDTQLLPLLDKYSPLAEHVEVVGAVQAPL
jgi:hypothetical protein